MANESTAVHPSTEDVEAPLIRSCLRANQDPEVAVIEGEWDKLHDPVTEPWDAE